jgi:hypothetical protein
MTQVVEPSSDAVARAAEGVTLDAAVDHWIGGRRVPGSSGRTGPIYDPATARLAREVRFASAADVDAAVAGPTQGVEVRRVN